MKKYSVTYKSSIIFVVFIILLPHCEEVDDTKYTDVRGYYKYSIKAGPDRYTGSFSINDIQGEDFSGAGEIVWDSTNIGFMINGNIDRDDNVEMFWTVVDIEIYDCVYDNKVFRGYATNGTWTDAIFTAILQ